MLQQPDLGENPLSPKAVRQSRELLSMEQDEFAQAIGVSIRAVRAWEHKDQDSNHSRNCTGAARLLIIRLVEDSNTSKRGKS